MKKCGQLQDYSDQDSRSVAAYLNGHGDGRAEMYERFLKHQKSLYPQYQDHQAIQDYADFCKKVTGYGQKLAKIVMFAGNQIVAAVIGISLAYFAVRIIS